MAAEPGISIWRAALSGLCASLIGIGLARFAYSPLIPVLVAEGWFTVTETAYLGAANLAGYLIGAVVARPIAARVGAAAALRAMMVLATVAFFACSMPWAYAWFLVWRLAAGVAGGMLMVLAAPTILPHVPPNRRGLVGGAIFTGVGLGIAASGTMVPLLLAEGLTETWIGLGLLSAALTLVGWFGWPRPALTALRGGEGTTAQGGPQSRSLKALYVEYALNAAGLVPHMVFLVDYLVREQGLSVTAGAGYWVLFGLGAMAGPLLAGYVADRIGFARALRAAFLIQAVGVALILVDGGIASLIVSSVIVGAFVPGIVALALGRVHELTRADHGAQQAAWSVCTVAFAVGQAASAYLYSFLIGVYGGLELVFVLGVVALIAALALDVAISLMGRGARRASNP